MMKKFIHASPVSGICLYLPQASPRKISPKNGNARLITSSIGGVCPGLPPSGRDFHIALMRRRGASPDGASERPACEGSIGGIRDLVRGYLRMRACAARKAADQWSRKVSGSK